MSNLSKKNIWNRIKNKLPFTTPLDVKEGLEFFKSRDQDRNRRSSPSSDEGIDLRCIWSVELYTPSYAKSLLNGFANLGWDTGEEVINRSPSPWVKGNRETSPGGGWLNLGTLTRERSEFSPRRERVVDLPNQVDYAISGLHSISPSITCLVVCFVLKKSASISYDRELRLSRSTTVIRKDKKRYQYQTPEQQKAESIKQIRKGFRIDIGRWFKNHFPGQFSSALALHDWPVCEFITLKKAQPFPLPDELDQDITSWLYALCIQSCASAWECTDGRALRFQTGDRLSDSLGSVNHYILAAREDAVNPKGLDPTGSGRTHEINMIDMNLQSMIANSMLIPFLHSIGSSLSEKRDSISADLGERKEILAFLEKAGQQVSSSIDTVNISNELIEITREENSLFFTSPDFIYLGRNKGASYYINLQQNIREKSVWIKGLEETVRGNYSQLSEIITAHENIRLQKQIRFLTRATVALGIITLITTFVNS